MGAIWLDSAVAALGWVLLHALWQVVLIAALAAVGLRALRGAAPQARYAVCAAALAACLALPLLHWLWLVQPSGQWRYDSDEALPRPLKELVDHLPLLVHAWASGVGLMSLRLGLGLVWVARLRRRATAAPAEWQARLDALRRRLHIHRPVPLRLLPTLDGPITVGAFRPLVLVPASLLTGLPAPLIDALLAHELAHVRRWDFLVNLLQSLAEALLFFHPAVWWLSARMRHEREQVADALAADALEGDRHRVATALAALSQFNASPASRPSVRRPDPDARAGRSAPPPFPALSARGGHLLQRIEQLMITTPHTTSWKLALPALLLACATLLVQAASHAPVAVDEPTQARSPQRQSGVVTAAAPVAAPAFQTVSGTQMMKLPVNARHVMVVDDSGRVMMAKDPDAIVPIASLTKLMTAMVVLDAHQDPQAMLRIDAADVDLLKHSRSRVAVGAQMTRAAALELALMSSENRAAAALARAYPGGTAAFEAAVQAKIQALGLTRTTLVDPTGLSPANTSTATEVARIAMAAAHYPDIARITSDKSSRVAINGRARELRNTNHLVGGKGWDIKLSKTGYTTEAGRCLTMRMKSGGQTLTVVLLDADGSAQRLRDASLIRKSLSRLAAA
ncbi:M56 family metallopeptidase [Roseateles amylovorans]|uniref:M56 family metallopeptidase n=1 Tax=Roseateles amylovorans TaxID=2978473 RepID=A0ABY6BB05_9BURK|nr:M56 family metallopeptidase [Roseateles amylovorans]UXH80377.1 M56 family metallopeptidase [Roseateles amylovorans]